MFRKIFVLLLLSAVTSYATVTLTNKTEKYDRFTLYYFYDESSTLDINDIEKMDFTQVIPNQFSQGYYTGTAWIKLNVTNHGDSEDYVLYFTEPFWSMLDLYTKNNDAWDIQKNGLNASLKERSIEDYNPSYKLHISPGESKTYYIKGQTHSGHIGEFKIFTEEEFFRPNRIDITDIYIIYACILFIIVLFSLYNLIVIKNRIFAYYIAYILSFIVFIAMKSGFYLEFGLSGWSQGLHVVGTIVVLFLVLFSGRFLELRTRMPMINRIFNVSAGLFLLFALLISQDVPYACLAFNLYSSLFFTLLLAVAIKALYQGLIGARYYLIALIIYMPAMGMMTLTFNGLLDNTDIHRYAFLAGSFIEILFFTLILTNKYNELNLQKIHRQKQLLKARKNNEKFLETKIEEKTSDLIKINKQLLKKTEELEITKEQLTRDILERTEAEKEVEKQKNVLHHQANHDSLTGLPNRALFSTRLKQGIKKAKKKEKGLALFFIDLDKFKEINDSLGHDVGDRVLTTITNILKSSIRKEDTLSRLAGDEFTIIMEDVVYSEDVSKLGHAILNMFAEPIHVDEHLLYITCSIGISLYPQDADNEKDLLKYADTAMYRAKESGRNNFQFYRPEMTTHALEQMHLKTSLRQAIDNEEFIIHYQPQVDIATDTLVGIEALLRWQHPAKGLLTPKKFIALAEETGMILEIDDWVMHTTMKQVSKWYHDGLDPGILALNISMRQLESPNFIHRIQHTMDTYGFKAEWLELEITEGHMMKNAMEIINKLKQVSKLGINISIDDFGTGYSSLSLLKRLPINRLKIDKSFIEDIPEDEEDIAIIKSIIVLARSLNLKVIAEGVETIEQINFLKSKNCKYVQGHYYFYPMSADELQEILLDNNR
ncbi:EAL domain-containing protein [Sulfurovum sp. XGS-02]|uniref:EAL domain-containing protein n=1 Tax=Sulfurovum sp. XGS-02 TaxID=2925411 RepID=UPI00206FF415|nr:EAL domain-containing protein [Sulfurovum sp. XGS-02]UPT76633.1 EAL domain-containing protein [Sulfurovum sp. XGS-02]